MLAFSILSLYKGSRVPCIHSIVQQTFSPNEVFLPDAFLHFDWSIEWLGHALFSQFSIHAYLGCFALETVLE